MPLAVIARLHDCKQTFLPRGPCDECVEFCEECERCKTKRTELQGVFAAQALRRTWQYDGPELEGQHVNVSRRQLPLAPDKVLPLYSMQGMTASPGLVAHWALPPRLDGDLKWLICYVILSRPPSLAQLISVGLSNRIREIIEGGPPDGIVQSFTTLFADKIAVTNGAAAQARAALGW